MSKRAIKEIPPDTLAQTRKAADPQSSIWVSANAGSGKTHVLSERVIRLLLDDVEPSTIVCLTYTKAAASVMANRVFERLAEWATLDDEKLTKAISVMEGQVPSAAKLTKARRLFARALETPGGLKIQTIHAFCQMVLGRFPLEANIAGHFDLIDDDLHKSALAESRRLVLQKAGNEPSGGLAVSLREVLGTVGEHALEALFDQALKERGREALAAFSKEVAEGGARRLFGFLGVDERDTEAGILGRAWPLTSFGVSELSEIAQLGRTMKPNSRGGVFASHVGEALATAGGPERFAALKRVLKKDGGISYQENIENTFGDLFADISSRLSALAAELSEIDDHLVRLRTAQLSVHGFILVDAVLREYETFKKRRTLLDHDDVIERTVKLLTQSGASAWVQYKLDQGINHILVDEAQDTSPPQWQIINTLTEEFFSGQTARGQNRTLFAVGDEKQSIYSFQGARPEIFSQTGTRIGNRAEVSVKKFDRARLNLSFRSTADVLSAVDLVFSVADNQRGLTFDADYRLHEPIRVHGPGRVEIWPIIPAPEKDGLPDDWMEGLRHEAASAVRLASAIAGTIKDWLVDGKLNEATGKPVNAGDIMVLVRKRGPFVHALSRELKNLHVAVSGADRLILTDHIAVKDLLAIARFCLFPGDDLSLAALLRSPLFVLTDDELRELAAYREPSESLFEKLAAEACREPKLERAHAELSRWQTEAAAATVFDFYARILARDKVRARLIQRLGVEAGEIIDEFLNHALASEKAGLSGLQDFVETLESAAPEIKREMVSSRDEVRIMTVHAAKGQEAPIVFLVDPPPYTPPSPPLLSMPGGEPLFIWEPLKEYRTSKTRSLHETLKIRGEEEFRRLLYVGMTRAEDQLIICGFGNSKSNGEAATWLKMAQAGLCVEGSPVRTEFQPRLGLDITVYQSSSGSPPIDVEAEKTRTGFLELPDILHRKMPPVHLAPRPLSPSSASHLIEADEENGQRSPVLSPEPDGVSFAIERGLVLHRLLELLPGIEISVRDSAVETYLARKAGSWTPQQRLKAKRDVLSIMENPEFESVFSALSRAEITVMGKLPVQGVERIVSGKIDRMIIEDGRVLIIDYKTNHAVPASLSEISPAYVTQMALYRALLKPLFEPKPIAAGLLFTSTATLYSLPTAMLDAALEALTDS